MCTMMSTFGTLEWETSHTNLKNVDKNNRGVIDSL